MLLVSCQVKVQCAFSVRCEDEGLRCILEEACLFHTFIQELSFLRKKAYLFLKFSRGFILNIQMDVSFWKLMNSLQLFSVHLILNFYSYVSYLEMKGLYHFLHLDLDRLYSRLLVYLQATFSIFIHFS
jgi:hypothetical protein